MYVWFKHPSIDQGVVYCPIIMYLQTKKPGYYICEYLQHVYAANMSKILFFFKFVIPCLMDQGAVYYPIIC